MKTIGVAVVAGVAAGVLLVWLGGSSIGQQPAEKAQALEVGRYQCERGIAPLGQGYTTAMLCDTGTGECWIVHGEGWRPIACDRPCSGAW